MKYLTIIFIAPLIIITSGCTNYREISRPISLVSPGHNKPFVILTADRSIVRKGESVDLIFTLVNPTKKKIALPISAKERNGYDVVSCDIRVEWKGKNGASSSSGGRDVISSPRVSYLMPRESLSYRMQWKFKGQGEGTATLKYKFVDEFPPVEFAVQTR